MKGVLILTSHMGWPMFQQQLSARLDLPVGSYQVMLACSRASDPDQVQKIPVHEGTVRCCLPRAMCRHRPRLPALIRREARLRAGLRECSALIRYVGMTWSFLTVG